MVLGVGYLNMGSAARHSWSTIDSSIKSSMFSYCSVSMCISFVFAAAWISGKVSYMKASQMWQLLEIQILSFSTILSSIHLRFWFPCSSSLKWTLWLPGIAFMTTISCKKSSPKGVISTEEGSKQKIAPSAWFAIYVKCNISKLNSHKRKAQFPDLLITFAGLGSQFNVTWFVQSVNYVYCKYWVYKPMLRHDRTLPLRCNTAQLWFCMESY